MLDERILLYAAHCGVDHQRVLFANEVRDPRVATETPDDGDEGYPIRDCIRHPMHGEAAAHDVALCFLERPWRGKATSLWSERDKAALAPGSEVLVLGYGRLQKLDSTLRKSAAWAVVQRNDVELIIGDEHQGTCPGDSGGPALAQTEDGFVLMGVLSEGQPVTCGAGWYADVMQNREWFEEHLSAATPASGCSVSRGVGTPENSWLLAVACAAAILGCRQLGPWAARRPPNYRERC
jgi:hypothetical protein